MRGRDVVYARGEKKPFAKGLLPPFLCEQRDTAGGGFPSVFCAKKKIERISSFFPLFVPPVQQTELNRRNIGRMQAWLEVPNIETTAEEKKKTVSILLFSLVLGVRLFLEVLFWVRVFLSV